MECSSDDADLYDLVDLHTDVSHSAPKIRGIIPQLNKFFHYTIFMNYSSTRID